jgi:hypothetical protein
MGVLVEIRDLPDSALRTLKERYAREGRTLSDYVRHELIALAERPTPEELLSRVESRAAVDLSESPAETLRRERPRE